MGNKFGKLFKSVKEDVVPQDVVPENVVPDDVVPQDVVPDDVVPDDVVPQDVVPDDVVPQGVIPDDVVSQDVIPQDVVPEDVIPEDVIPQDVVPQDVIPDDVVPEDVVPEDVIPEDVIPEDVIPVAGKRKATEDDGNRQEKHRRFDFSCDNELPSISGHTESRNTAEASTSQRSRKRKAAADDGPMAAKKRILDLCARFRAKYFQEEQFGQGAYGSVYAGYRKADNMAVVIKHIYKNEDFLKHEDDDGKEIPMEVAVMLKLASAAERHSAPIALLDWLDLEEQLVLVLERPVTAVDLRQYIQSKPDDIEEPEVKIVIRQLVDAAIHLQEQHIFHGDIKMENLLIETSVNMPRVRVIDFGASCFVEEGDIFKDSIMGTHAPPEWYRQGEYEAGPTTVFQIGAVLVNMLNNNTLGNFSHRLKIKCRVSKNCKDFSKACLNEDPEKRLTLEQLRNHLWLI